MSDWLASFNLQAAPYLSGGWLWLLLATAVLLSFIAWRRRAFDFFARVVFLALLVFLLLNIGLRQDMREALPDKVLVVVDESNSQKIGGRDKTAAAALVVVQEKLKARGKAVETIVLRAPQKTDPRRGDTTGMFDVLSDSLMTLPLQQMAGTILITDGQVHDVPDQLGALEKLGPFHVLLTGKPDEFDHKVNIVSAPKYGLLDETARVSVQVDTLGAGQAGGAPVTIEVWQDGTVIEERAVLAGVEETFAVVLKHPGQNVFEFRIPVVEGELTDINNNAPVIINGVRDRLKVLLVSGSPHMGERAWRNLLKSDPGIDLVHFTILRSPTSVDAAPTREMSLIVFPVDELFAEKIDDFDLIIFDKYQQYNLLAPQYFANIRRYVREGGAFLMAMGSDKGEDSLFKTALADSLPVVQSGGEVSKGLYRPTLSDKGQRHPITADLSPLAEGWGDWMTQASIGQRSGQVLMTGLSQNPLLVIDQVEEGRVAVLASDNIWFWSKGGEAAGPYTELLRNLSHWLMKEPELEEDYIKAEASGNIITVSMRAIGDQAKTVEMKSPSGAIEQITLDNEQAGWQRKKITATENGVYRFSAGERKAFVVVGTANSPEYADVHTTPDLLAPVVKATGGSIVWFAENNGFDLRGVSPAASRKGGDGWFGLKQNEAFAVTGVKTKVLVNKWLFLIVILMGLVAAWWLEGGRRLRPK